MIQLRTKHSAKYSAASNWRGCLKPRCFKNHQAPQKFMNLRPYLFIPVSAPTSTGTPKGRELQPTAKRLWAPTSRISSKELVWHESKIHFKIMMLWTIANMQLKLKEGVCLEYIGKIWKVSPVNGGKICAVAKSWDPLPPSRRCQPTDLIRHWWPAQNMEFLRLARTQPRITVCQWNWKIAATSGRTYSKNVKQSK